MSNVTNDDGSVTVPLNYPIQVEGNPVTSLTLKRLKGAQFRKVNLARLTNGDDLAKIIETLAAIPPSSVDQLDGADLASLTEVILGFFGKGPATGGAS